MSSAALCYNVVLTGPSFLMFSRRSQMLGFALMLHDVALTAAAFLLAYAICAHATPSYVGGRYPPPIYPLETYWPLLLGIVVVWPVLGYGLGLYREVQTRPPREVARDLVKLTFFGFLILLAGLIFLRTIPLVLLGHGAS